MYTNAPLLSIRNLDKLLICILISSEKEKQPKRLSFDCFYYLVVRSFALLQQAVPNQFILFHKIGDKESREKRVYELIEQVGLPVSVMDALPGQLSGGQRQRVAIARALSLQPDAIIADEPTSALDVSVRAQILNLLMDLKKDLGLAMVFISHDIQTVRYISDRIIVMNGGRPVEEGTAEQVFNNPRDEYTKLLLGAAPSLLYPDLGK